MKTLRPAGRLAGLWLLVILSGLLYAVRGVGSALFWVATRALDGRSASIGGMAGRSAPRRNASPPRNANPKSAKSVKRGSAQRPLTARAADLFTHCAAAAVQGWRTGMAEGRARHAEHTERIQQRQREQQETLPRPQPPAPQPAEPAAPATAPPGADVIPMRKAKPPMTMTTTQTEPGPSGETIDYPTTLASLEALADAAGKIRAQVEEMTGGLSTVLANDPETLGKIMAVEEVAEQLSGAAKAARETFVGRHADIHEAHAANPHAAQSSFYAQG